MPLTSMPLSPRLLEAVNGTLLIVYLGVMWFFVRYIWRRFRARHGSLRDCYRDVSGAIAILVLVTGDALIRAPVWLVRHLANTGRPTAALADLATAVIVAGALVAIVGGLCIMREFSARRLRLWAPAALVALALAFGFGLAL